MKRLISYFLKGLLIFVPFGLTIFIIVWVFTTLDGLLKLPFPGLGLVITIAAITVVGFLASGFVGKKLFILIDKLITKVPIVKLLYSAIKDVMAAFVGDKKSFDRPVVVELIAGGPKAVGFITQDDLKPLGMAGEVAVYLPQSYNFAGSVLIFPAERVKPLDIDSSKAMAFVVSGGVSVNS